jgi:hypothetical protein
MADGNLHLVIAAGDDAATRARIEDMVYRPLARSAVGVRRARHRAREARLSTFVAHRGRDFHHAPPQERARPKGILNPGKVFA